MIITTTTTTTTGVMGGGTGPQGDKGEETEPEGSPGLGEQTEAEPLQELSQIVWTRYMTVQTPMWYHITCVFLST